MFEKLRRLLRTITASSDDDPESFDHPRPQRVNPNPPARDWFARVSSRSHEASARREAKALEALDAKEPVLSPEASRKVDEALAKMTSGSSR
jgi:hypothetical protein